MILQDYFGELVLRPHKIVTIRTDVHALRLSESRDLWYGGGGVFNPGPSAIPAVRARAGAGWQRFTTERRR